MKRERPPVRGASGLPMKLVAPPRRGAAIGIKIVIGEYLASGSGVETRLTRTAPAFVRVTVRYTPSAVGSIFADINAGGGCPRLTARGTGI